MKIAIDAMGGDFAPGEVVKGAVIGARENNVGIIFAGPQEKIKQELANIDISGLDIDIAHTDEYLLEGEQPAYALRTKRNASIAVATKLVREGKAQAVLGAGPTGGILAAAVGYLGTIEGISRPVLGGAFVGFAPQTLVMDVGGNIDCRPDQLVDFAIVGTVFARKAFNIPNPRVALLSIGSEEGKGNEQVKASYPLLKNSGLNFIGNIEGIDIPAGKANVVICDGFVGNIVGKFCEGLGKTAAKWLEKKLEGKISQAEREKIVREWLMLTVPADYSGGGPILAINGVVFKAHGRARSPEIATTIKYIKQAVETDIVGELKAQLAKIRSKLNTNSPATI